MKNKVIKVIVCGVAVLIVVVFFLKANSYNISLSLNGLTCGNLSIIDEDINSSGESIRIVKAVKNDQNTVLVKLTKNIIGFWFVSEIREECMAELPLIQMSWIKTVGVQRDSFENESTFVIEYNGYYLGNNAITKLKLEKEQLPNGYVIHIFQVGSEYVLHIISDGNTLPIENIYQNLLANGCVQ